MMVQKLSSNQIKPKAQYLFIVCLVSVGIGNIAFPPSIPIFSSYYLPFCLLVVLGTFAFNARRMGAQLHYPLMVLLVFLSFLPGFIVTSLNPYGQTKLLAVFVALILIVAPSMSRNMSANIELALRIILLIAVGTSVCLLLLGESDVTGRIALWGLNPISTGRVTGLAVVISGAVLVTKFRIIAPPWLALLAVPIGVVATFQSGSRGPILAIMVSVAVILLVTGTAKSFIQRAIVLGLLGVGAWFLFSSRFLEGTRLTTVDANGRDILFEAAVETIVANPIGIGWGNFYSVLPNFSRVDAFTLYPHNIFLEIGVEGGWFALVTFVILVILSFRNLLRGIQSGSSTAAIVLAVLIFALVNASLSSDFVGNRLLWLSIGMSLLTVGFRHRAIDENQTPLVKREFVGRSNLQ
ncbi:O-antigen ligase family protein [Corynebacteriaceae bacterium 6-324]